MWSERDAQLCKRALLILSDFSGRLSTKEYILVYSRFNTQQDAILRSKYARSAPLVYPFIKLLYGHNVVRKIRNRIRFRQGAPKKPACYGDSQRIYFEDEQEVIRTAQLSQASP